MHKNNEAMQSIISISQVPWCFPSEKVKLKSDEGHIWIASIDCLDDDVKSLFLLLSEDEWLESLYPKQIASLEDYSKYSNSLNIMYNPCHFLLTYFQ